MKFSARLTESPKTGFGKGSMRDRSQNGGLKTLIDIRRDLRIRNVSRHFGFRVVHRQRARGKAVNGSTLDTWVLLDLDPFNEAAKRECAYRSSFIDGLGIRP